MSAPSLSADAAFRQQPVITDHLVCIGSLVSVQTLTRGSSQATIDLMNCAARANAPVVP